MPRATPDNLPPAPDSWSEFAVAGPLAILTDLDGTLVPFAATPDLARPDPELISLLEGLAALPRVRVAVVSGRPRASLDAFFGSAQSLLLCADHGGWVRDEAGWRPAVDPDPGELEGLVTDLVRLARRHPEALLERKTWSAALHFRRVSAPEKEVLLVEADSLIAPWLSTHPDFERLEGAETIEIRPVGLRKSIAVAWVRLRVPAGTRLLALGDDATDEDLFEALAPDDRAILVGAERGRATHAGWRIETSEAAREFLGWLAAARSGQRLPSLEGWPERITPTASQAPPAYRLLVVSNRLPELRSTVSSPDARRRNVGGLVSAIEPVLESRTGVWLGWSGRTVAKAGEAAFGLDDRRRPSLAWVDFSEHWQRRYYNGLCNGALWPLLHSFPSHVRLRHEDWSAYREVNQAFATAARRLVDGDGTVWIHDYHLLLLGRMLRAGGHRGRIGFFLHIPFPGPDIFALFPWAEEVLDALLDLDLIGFHTQAYADNFIHCARSLLGANCEGGQLRSRGRATRVGAFPLGILPEGFQEVVEPAVVEEFRALTRAIAPGQLILGVDRLDYTKGIPERIEAFGRMLEAEPGWRRKVSLVQVSVPSRADVREYAEQRARIENIVGRINGELGDADWVPIRYLYRSYGRSQLSELYRAARVGYVTPLRDGMNLVAKEYVAAQDPADPGVLVLSRFAGAAAELSDAVLTNPWDVEGMARDLDRALRLSLTERRARHARLLEVVSRTTAVTWASDFLAALDAAPETS